MKLVRPKQLFELLSMFMQPPSADPATEIPMGGTFESYQSLRHPPPRCKATLC